MAGVKKDSYFQAGNDAFKEARTRCSRALREFNACGEDTDPDERVNAWHILVDPAGLYGGASPNAAPLVNAPVWMDYGLRVRIAPTAVIGRNLTIQDTPVADVFIGEHVDIGPNVTIVSVKHSLYQMPNSERLTSGLNVAIKNSVSIGAGVIIMPGVRIGHHSVITCGAVVISDVPPYSTSAGVPARVQGQVHDIVQAEPANIITTVPEAIQHRPFSNGVRQAAALAARIQEAVNSAAAAAAARARSGRLWS